MKVFNRIKEYVRRNPHCWLALYLPAYLLMFFAVERLVPEDADYWLSYLPIDDSIPFLEGFVIPYCCWFPLVIGTGLYLMFTDADGFRKYVYFIMIGFTGTLVFCMLSPNGQALRPTVFPRDNILTRLVGLLYAADTPTNVFPSMHVIGAVAASIACFYSEKLKKLRFPVLALSVLITASTVFIKQHSILDVFGGLAVCIPLYFLIYHKPERRTRNETAQA